MLKKTFTWTCSAPFPFLYLDDPNITLQSFLNTGVFAIVQDLHPYPENELRKYIMGK